MVDAATTLDLKIIFSKVEAELGSCPPSPQPKYVWRGIYAGSSSIEIGDEEIRANSHACNIQQLAAQLNVRSMGFFGSERLHLHERLLLSSLQATMADRHITVRHGRSLSSLLLAVFRATAKLAWFTNELIPLLYKSVTERYKLVIFLCNHVDSFGGTAFAWTTI